MSHAKSLIGNILVIDAIPFFGGSKIATRTLLSLLKQQGVKISLLTNTPEDWPDDYHIMRFFELPFLRNRDQGLPYFLKHIWITLFLFMAWCRTEKKTVLLGPSGPGVDLSAYLFAFIIKTPIIQLIHGPVAPSKTIARCLRYAHIVAHLPDTQPSIQKCLARISPVNGNTCFANHQCVLPFNNGIPQHKWPGPSTNSFTTAHIFWAASLLKWKGLDLLDDALMNMGARAPETTICYIRPKGTLHDISSLPEKRDRLTLYETPSNLDQLRAACNIFVSTSHREPFGLSILEAMASGLCVIIPSDGAYWDTVLKDGVHCLKYTPDNSKDLRNKIHFLCQNMILAKTLGRQARNVAETYRAEHTLLPIINNVIGKMSSLSEAKKKSSLGRNFS